jgi:hypothetical protein
MEKVSIPSVMVVNGTLKTQETAVTMIMKSSQPMMNAALVKDNQLKRLMKLQLKKKLLKRKLLKKKLRRPQSKLLKAAQTMIQFLIHMVILALTGTTQDQKHAVITIPRTLLLLSLAACANGMTCQPRPLSSPQITHILTSCSLITSLLSSQKTIANTATTSRTS